MVAGPKPPTPEFTGRILRRCSDLEIRLGGDAIGGGHENTQASCHEGQYEKLLKGEKMPGRNSSLRTSVISLLLRRLNLRFPGLFLILAILTLADLLIPDLIPFVDGIGSRC